MKLKLGELRPIMEALPAVLDKEIPAKTAYWLARAFKQIQPEFEPFERARQKLVEKHGKRYERDRKDKKGQVIEKKGELIIKDNTYPMKDQELFNKEYNELAEQEIEIKYEPITVEQLGDAKIKGTDILKLGRLIKEV